MTLLCPILLRYVRSSVLTNLNLHKTCTNMAKSRFEYVKKFEVPDQCLPNCWIVVRVDGKGFHKFSDKHSFVKPNDDRSLELMNRAARQVMGEFKEVVLAYGQSDEYSFIFRRNSQAYNRRASKLMTTIASLFASTYVYHWTEYFSDTPLLYPPAFDARTILYPSNQNLRDYLSWRQADCHINNLYNTVFWKLVHSGLTTRDAQERLKGTTSGDKNEILFSEFDTNYNTLPELYRKGTVLVREKASGPNSSATQVKAESSESSEQKSVEGEGHTSGHKHFPVTTEIVALNCDIIGADFWKNRPHLLGSDSKD